MTTGFTAGIATVIATLQIKDVLGLPVEKMPDGYVEKLGALWAARAHVSVAELGVAAVDPRAPPPVARASRERCPRRSSRSAPSPLVATVLARVWPGFHVATIGSRFHSMVDGHVVAGHPARSSAAEAPVGLGGG